VGFAERDGVPALYVGFADSIATGTPLAATLAAMNARILADWPGYVDWFHGLIATEPHATEPFEDRVASACGMTPHIHGLTRACGSGVDMRPLARWVACPTPAIHGDSDTGVPIVRAAKSPSAASRCPSSRRRSPTPRRCGRATAADRCVRRAAGLEVRSGMHNRFEHLAYSDLALVQGGPSTTKALVATRRPFLSYPLERHFEQCIQVRNRLHNHCAERSVRLRESSAAELADRATAVRRTTCTSRDGAPAWTARRGGTGRRARR
jgi:hypothetical protein